MTGDEVCWYPVMGGCFQPATAIFKAGTKEIPVCANHAPFLASRAEFRRIELP